MWYGTLLIVFGNLIGIMISRPCALMVNFIIFGEKTLIYSLTQRIRFIDTSVLTNESSTKVQF